MREYYTPPCLYERGGSAAADKGACNTAKKTQKIPPHAAFFCAKPLQEKPRQELFGRAKHNFCIIAKNFVVFDHEKQRP
ncbi:MAG TPA: hypothetical protein DDY77_00715 [Clostridiales bacterium]|nr:hypothetical protein [Clostridiales bacterium]